MSSLAFCKVESINYHFTLSVYRMYTHILYAKALNWPHSSWPIILAGFTLCSNILNINCFTLTICNLVTNFSVDGLNIIVIEIPIRRSCSTKHHKYSITSDCKKQRSAGTLCPTRIEFYQIKLIFIKMIVSKIQLL